MSHEPSSSYHPPKTYRAEERNNEIEARALLTSCKVASTEPEPTCARIRESITPVDPAGINFHNIWQVDTPREDWLTPLRATGDRSTSFTRIEAHGSRSRRLDDRYRGIAALLPNESFRYSCNITAWVVVVSHARFTRSRESRGADRERAYDYSRPDIHNHVPR